MEEHDEGEHRQDKRTRKGKYYRCLRKSATIFPLFFLPGDILHHFQFLPFLYFLVMCLLLSCHYFSGHNIFYPILSFVVGM